MKVPQETQKDSSSALNQICGSDIIDFELTPDREFLRHVLVQATHCHNRNQINLENQKSLHFWNLFFIFCNQHYCYICGWWPIKVKGNSIVIGNICDHMETLRIRLAAICLWKLIPFEQIWKFLLKSFPCEKFSLDPSYRKMSTNFMSIVLMNAAKWNWTTLEQNWFGVCFQQRRHLE